MPGREQRPVADVEPRHRAIVSIRDANATGRVARVRTGVRAHPDGPHLVRGEDDASVGGEVEIGEDLFESREASSRLGAI